MRMRTGRLEDVLKILPRAPGRRAYQGWSMQIARSQVFAIEDADGVMAVGGILPDPAHSLRELWVLVRRSPKPNARALVRGCDLVLANVGFGDPVIAWVRSGDVQANRFAAFMGLTRYESRRVHMLGADHILYRLEDAHVQYAGQTNQGTARAGGATGAPSVRSCQ